MKKAIFVGLAILAVSTSGALAAKKTAKPKAPAAAAATTTNTGGAAPLMMGRLVRLTASYMRKVNANPA